MKISKLFDIFQTPKRLKHIMKIGDLFKRFSHISESKFDELDDQSLINCKEASQDWPDRDCNQCRAAFICGMMTRRYYCRACGQFFCSKCQSNHICAFYHSKIEK